MNDNEFEVREVFSAALELRAASDVTQFLDTRCAGRPELRARVEALLSAHQTSGRFLGGLSTESEPELVEEPGSIIDRFQLLNYLGEGGFGVVFLARQHEPVCREVALKVIKPGMDSRQVVERFARERQTLAQLDHPNIARVFDGGTTPSGRPYFVMELVTGTPITQYCDDHRLGIRERLTLFLGVCRTVQYAHQKGLIHCDLKPSNLLVTDCDNGPLVKVIDFGISKAINLPATESDHPSGASSLGSPNYMSPEQWPSSGFDVDTRSDVYSLGTLLFELLTGTTPFDRSEWAAVSWQILHHQLRQQQPQLPSARVMSTDSQREIRAAHRGREPQRLAALLRKELDWIVLRALENDRSRRYDSAATLADDIERYLNDDQVLACPPFRRYRVGKFVRRHRVAIGSLSAIIAALAVCSVISVWAACRAYHAESLALQRLDREQSAVQLAERAAEWAISQQQEIDQQRRRAELNLVQARSVIERMLKRVSPSPEAVSGEMTRQQLLQDALLYYQQFLRNNAADPSLQLDIANTHFQISALHAGLGQWTEAEASAREAIQCHSALAHQWPNDTTFTSHLGKAKVGLAEIFRVTNRSLIEAEALYREALLHLDRLSSVSSAPMELTMQRIEVLHKLGHFLAFTTGRRSEAEPVLAQAIVLARRLAAMDIDARHQIMLANQCNSLGILYRQSQSPERAQEMHRESLEILQRVANNNDAFDLREETARALSHLGLAQLSTSDLAGARENFRQAIALRNQLSIDHPPSRSVRLELALNESQLAGILLLQGSVSEAETELRNAVARLEKLNQERPSDTSNAHHLIATVRRLGDVLTASGQTGKASAFYRIASNSPAAGAPAYAAQAWHLANCPLVVHRDPGRAVRLAQQAVDESPGEGDFWKTLGAAQFRAGKFETSIATMQQAKSLLADRGDPIPGYFLSMAFHQLGDHQGARREWKEAEASYRNSPTWSQDDDFIAAEANKILAQAD